MPSTKDNKLYSNNSSKLLIIEPQLLRNTGATCHNTRTPNILHKLCHSRSGSLPLRTSLLKEAAGLHRHQATRPPQNMVADSRHRNTNLENSTSLPSKVVALAVRDEDLKDFMVMAIKLLLFLGLLCSARSKHSFGVSTLVSARMQYFHFPF